MNLLKIIEVLLCNDCKGLSNLGKQEVGVEWPGGTTRGFGI